MNSQSGTTEPEAPKGARELTVTKNRLTFLQIGLALVMRKYEITLVGFNEATKVFTTVAEDACSALENLWYAPEHKFDLLPGEKEAITEVHVEEV